MSTSESEDKGIPQSRKAPAGLPKPCDGMELGLSDSLTTPSETLRAVMRDNTEELAFIYQ